MPAGSGSTTELRISDGTTMLAYVAHPEAPGRAPAVMVFQEAFGVNHHIRDVAGRFARGGYLALAPELYHRSAPPGWKGDYNDFPSVMPHVGALRNEALELDLRACFEWLKSRDDVEAETTFATGFCMGGRVSFLANSLLPLKAAASFYGGGIAPGPMGPGLLERTPALHGPMLFVWGGQDQHIGPEQRRAVTEALDEVEKTYVNAEFSDAGHGFFCDARSSYNPRAARQAGALLMEFLRTA